MSQPESTVVGYLDGYRYGHLEGWAHIPDEPGRRVEVEVVANGFIVAKAVAKDYRGDLRYAGIGDGRHAFRIPLELDTRRTGPVPVIVRGSDGFPLSNGEIVLGEPLQATEEEAEEFRAFVASVLGEASTVYGAKSVTNVPPPVRFIVHAAQTKSCVEGANGTFGDSYQSILNCFVPVLETFGTVHLVDDPLRDVDFLYSAYLSQGETALFLSFAPPHHTVLGLRCPTIPVMSWAYPTIPTAFVEDDSRHDWRYVLRQTGRAIVLSSFAAQALKASLGADFPILALPVPLWRRLPHLASMPVRSVGGDVQLSFNGFCIDSRQCSFDLEMVTPPLPASESMSASLNLTLSGIVYMSVVVPDHEHKNWRDTLSAFVAAFSDEPEATLVLKMQTDCVAVWWSRFYECICKLPDFKCRIIVLHGIFEEGQYTALVEASHWLINASTCDGHCIGVEEFMIAARPAISPRHTAMLDFLDETNSMIVDSAEEPCAFPNDPCAKYVTTRHRLSWSDLVEKLKQSLRIISGQPETYASMAKAARARIRCYCDDSAVVSRLDSFLGLGMSEGVASPSGTTEVCPDL